MSASPLALDRLRGSLSPKTACAVVLVSVFLCGAVVGGAAIDLVVHSRTRAPSFDSVQGRAAYFERLRTELALTDEQSEQVKSFLSDSWQYYRTVMSDAKQRVESVLRPDQKEKFERLLLNQLK